MVPVFCSLALSSPVTLFFSRSTKILSLHESVSRQNKNYLVSSYQRTYILIKILNPNGKSTSNRITAVLLITLTSSNEYTAQLCAGAVSVSDGQAAGIDILEELLKISKLASQMKEMSRGCGKGIDEVKFNFVSFQIKFTIPDVGSTVTQIELRTYFLLAIYEYIVIC